MVLHPDIAILRRRGAFHHFAVVIRFVPLFVLRVPVIALRVSVVRIAALHIDFEYGGFAVRFKRPGIVHLFVPGVLAHSAKVVHTASHACALVLQHTGVDITRVSGDSSGGDSASFYGVGSAVLCTDGSAYVDTCDITTDADGGAGVFAYDKGTAYVSGAKIVTEQGASGGLHAAGGGTLYAWDCDVETGGESSAAIRSDRGGGTMVIEDGNYITRGQGSPAVYSTADITAAYATLEAKGSEAVCIEGDNQLRLFNCNLTGNMADLPQNGLTWNVILYQSMSGDSKEGNSLFEMNGGILEAGNGGMFYTTNTQSTFVLKGVELRPAKGQEFLLRAAGNSNGRGWGTKGHNGADCSFTAIQQELSGDVQWDSVSTLKFYLTDKSTLNGAFVQDEKDAGEGGEGLAELFIDSSSVWYVNGDCTVTKLHCAGTIEDTSGKSVTVRKSDGTVLAEGTSAYSITVEEYDKAPDLSGAGVVSNYEDFRKEKPAELH